MSKITWSQQYLFAAIICLKMFDSYYFLIKVSFWLLYQIYTMVVQRTIKLCQVWNIFSDKCWLRSPKHIFADKFSMKFAIIPSLEAPCVVFIIDLLVIYHRLIVMLYTAKYEVCFFKTLGTVSKKYMKYVEFQGLLLRV